MTSVGLGRPWLALFGLVRTTWDLTKMTDCWKASIARAPGITQSPPRGIGTLAENSGWAARFVLAEALGSNPTPKILLEYEIITL